MKHVYVSIHLEYYSARKKKYHLQQHEWTHKISGFKKQDRHKKKNIVWFHLFVDYAEDDP